MAKALEIYDNGVSKSLLCSY